MNKKIIKRCEWVNNESMIEYHDNEWGLPAHDDSTLLEFIILESAQAGLSWSTILKKRKGYQEAFKNFDASKIATFKDADIQLLMNNSNIIRNRLKINAAISGAKAFLKIQKKYGSFDRYIWSFMKGKPKVNKIKNIKEIPIFTNKAKELSIDLKKKGFSFVGPTICYAFMQAIGMVNDHEINCFRWKEVQGIID